MKRTFPMHSILEVSVLALLSSATPSRAQTIVGSVSLGAQPGGFLAVNPNTARVYVAGGYAQNQLTVVDVSDITHPAVVTTISGSGGGSGVAVNPNTNFFYTSNGFSGQVLKYDGATNTLLASAFIGACPGAFDIDPITNLVYVTRQCAGGGPPRGVDPLFVLGGGSLTIIGNNLGTGGVVGFPKVNTATGVVYACGGGDNVWGPPPTFTPITILTAGCVSAINPVTNRLYLEVGTDIQVLDGNTNSLIATIVGANAQPQGVNTSTNRVYALDGTGQVVKVIDGATNTVVGSFSLGPGVTPIGLAVDSGKNLVYVAGVASGSATLFVVQFIAPPPAPPQSVTMPLNPTAANQFPFDNNVHNYAVQYPAGTSFSGVNMTVTATQTPQANFQQRVAGTPFASAVCIAYDGENGYCEDYQVSCTNTSGNSITCPSETTPTINGKTSFDTQQPIVNPGFLTTPLGTNNWTNIFNSFYLQRIDPTIKGRTRGFSEFVAVDLGATNTQGAAQFTLLGPLQNDVRIFPVGTVIPVEFQLTSIAEPGVSVTDAIAGITVVMLSDANGNPTSKIVLQQPAAFTYQGGSYVYSLNTKGYAPGVYNLTVYGNAFVAQQVQFTLPVSTSGVHLVTTVQSLTLDSSTNRYIAVLNVVNSGNNTADGVIVTASQLNSTSTTTTLPISLGDISSGASATVTLTYPTSAGAAGSRGALTISESYAGGSGGGGSRVTLP